MESIEASKVVFALDDHLWAGDFKTVGVGVDLEEF